MNLKDGAVAQLVEQRTENPCVPGSSPGGATSPERLFGAFLYIQVPQEHKILFYEKSRFRLGNFVLFFYNIFPE